jgi:hypothetical protein
MRPKWDTELREASHLTQKLHAEGFLFQNAALLEYIDKRSPLLEKYEPLAET